MTISIVTPCYNGAAFFVAMTQSVRAQTFTDYEHIIVNDGSTDDSAALCDAYAADARVRVIHQENRGEAVARARGIEAATGDAVYILNQDDVMSTDALERLNAALKYHPDAVAVYGDIALIDKDGAPLRPNHAHGDRPGGHILPALLLHSLMPPGTALMRRDALTRIPLSCDLAMDSDVLLACRLATLGPIYPLHDTAPVLRWRVHGDNLSYRDLDIQSRLAMCDALFADPLIVAAMDAKRLNNLRRTRRARACRNVGRLCLEKGTDDTARQAFRQAMKEQRDWQSMLLWVLAVSRLMEIPALRQRLCHQRER